MARVELENAVRFAQKTSEARVVRDRSRDETVLHFFSIVRTNLGVALRFDDAGSRWVNVKTSRYPQGSDQ